MGGPIVTASGLIFVGATNDNYFRAFDTRTGKQVWETELEASGHSIPMTFMGKDGRQYVVIAAGGGSFIQSPRGTKIVAFALPDGKPTHPYLQVLVVRARSVKGGTARKRPFLR